MSVDQDDERAYARMARTSWVNARAGARHLAERASEWARAEDIETHIRERNARELSEQTARIARANARRSKRAPSDPPQMRAHALTAHEVKARAFGTRAFRSCVALAAPCALIAAPPWMLMNGDPGALILWPVAYGYLMWTGYAFRKDLTKEDEHETEEDEQRRKLPQRSKPDTSLPPTAEEVAIIERIQSWDANAADRKLHEVTPGSVVIDESGILIPMTFTGLWTPSKLDAQADQIRALLAIPDEVRTQVKPGGTADRAVFRVRTRIRELDLRWTPEREGLGLDADTSEIIHVNTGGRILVAGTSGSGKSVTLRVLLADALLRQNAALVILDLKKAEGALWRRVARVETKPEGIQSVIDDLIAEMEERENIMEAREIDLWEPTADRPKIVVAVDEGAELMAEVPEAIGSLRSLARRARAAEILLWWATQKPTMSGNGPGLDSQISGQLTSKVCLAVAGAKETRVVLGEDATGNGWHAEDLELGGWALIAVQGEKRKPDPMRVWFMTKEDVKALPPHDAWRRQKAERSMEVPEALAVALHLSRDSNGVSTARLAAALNIRDTEVHARMREFGADPEPNAFAIDGEGKARGYRRSVLEDALQRWETTT